MDEVKLSKFISLILRHQPEVINIKLDEKGWANVDELIDGINRKGYHIDFKILSEIVKNNNKQRFTFNDDQTKIRANQGHSIDVDVELEEVIPPDILYHGTSRKYVENIMKEGIKKQGRNYVHLSQDEKTAIIVGKRHGDPVVFQIDAKQMSMDGILFYQSKNKVWLTEYINPRYLSRVSDRD